MDVIDLTPYYLRPKNESVLLEMEWWGSITVGGFLILNTNNGQQRSRIAIALRSCVILAHSRGRHRGGRSSFPPRSNFLPSACWCWYVSIFQLRRLLVRTSEFQSTHLILPRNAKTLLPLDIWQRSQFMAWLPFRSGCSDALSQGTYFLGMLLTVLYQPLSHHTWLS